MLALLTGLTDLFCWTQPQTFIPELADAYAALRPTRVPARLGGSDCHSDHTTPNLAILLFSQVAHLEIVDDEWHTWSGFELLPCLTDLRLPTTIRDRDIMEGPLKLLFAGSVQSIVRSIKVNTGAWTADEFDLVPWELLDHRVVWTSRGHPPI